MLDQMNVVGGYHFDVSETEGNHIRKMGLHEA